MNDTQRDFLSRAAAEAAKANHPFPEMAAAEAALESNYGLSELAREGNNLFGCKQHQHPVFGTLNLPTHEFIRGAWIPAVAAWVKYPDLAACFADRLATLQRLATVRLQSGAKAGSLEFPHYAAALIAGDAETFVRCVSETWSTDPNRAAKVISIYQEFQKEQPA
jgi:flagellum-specific peptidoglycan hydrolase FlgJ